MNCDTPNPRFKFNTSPFYPNTFLKDWEPRNGIRRAGTSAFGFGGTNAHMIMSEFKSDLFDYKQERKSLPAIEFNKKRCWYFSDENNENISVENYGEPDEKIDEIPSMLELTETL